MFFVLSKILEVLLEPLAHPFILLGFSLLTWVIKKPKAMRMFAYLAVALPLCYGILPVSALPLKFLENAYQIPELEQKPIDGIIVLGGHTKFGAVAQTRNQWQQSHSAERLTMALALHRKHPNSILVFSCRTGKLQPRGWTEAETTRRILLDLAWPQANVIYEDTSRNTFESAIETKRLTVPQLGSRWILITSASHMYRAIGAFEAAGWPSVTPYPVDYQTTDGARDLYSLRTGIAAVRIWLPEVFGIIAYWATGRSRHLIS